MAVRTHDGKQVKKVWNRRRLEEWKDDIRYNTEDKPELVLHPIVDPPPKHEKEGLSYSKAWRQQFWDDYGRQCSRIPMDSWKLQGRPTAQPVAPVDPEPWAPQMQRMRQEP